MITLIIAAAAVATQPAGQAQQASHEQHTQMGPSAEHKADCCKDCCDDMAANHEGHGSDHSEHGAHQQ